MISSFESRIFKLKVWRALVVLISIALFFVLANSAQAADTINSSVYLDTDNDGQVDTIRWTFDENVTACVYEAGDWTVNTATDMTIAVTGLTCTGTDAILDIDVSADANETGADTDPVVSYANQGNADDLFLFAAAGAHASVTATDSAKPVIHTVIVYTSGDRNRLVYKYTEKIVVSTDAGGDSDIAAGATETSSASMGAMTTAKTMAGIATWDGSSDMTTNAATDNSVFLVSDEKQLVVTVNALTAGYFNAGSTAPAAPDNFTPIEDANDITDYANNPVNSSQTPIAASGGSAWDITAPTISDTYSCDADADGDIERIQATFSESMYDAAFTAGNFEADNDATNNSTGEEVPASFNTATGGCDGAADDTDANDDKGRFELTTGISGTQLAYLHNVTAGAKDLYGNRLATGDALGTENDKAAPAPISAVLRDATSGDGLLDQIIVDFSETVEDVVDGSLDWAISSAANFSGLAEGTVECSTGSASSNECIYNFTTTTVKTNVGDLTLTYTAGTSVTDAATNNAATFAYSSGSTPALTDAAAPVVASVSPADGATTAAITSNIVITFSEPMDTTFVEGGEYSISPDPGSFAAAAWTVGDTVVTLNPDTSLLCSTTYTFTTAEASIDAAAGSPTGLLTTGPEDGDWSFTTLCSSGGSTAATPPKTWSLVLDAPNGGESYQAGEKATINWTTGGTGQSSFVNLYYAANGIDFTLIEAGVQNTSSYLWTVPEGVNTAEAKFLVETTDLSSILAQDTSDNFFTIGVPEIASEPEPVPEPIMEPTNGDMGLSPVTGLPEEISIVSAHDYITSPSYSTVYYVDADMVRHPFPDHQTYFTWSNSFSDVKLVTDATLSTLTLGVQVLPRYEVVLVKIQSVNKVYALELNPEDSSKPVLRWITSEDVAWYTYGEQWSDYVIDISPTSFNKFAFGADVNHSDEISVNLPIMKTRFELNR